VKPNGGAGGFTHRKRDVKSFQREQKKNHTISMRLRGSQGTTKSVPCPNGRVG
jgi:hypothetical protein